MPRTYRAWVPRRAALRLSRVRTARLPPSVLVNTAPRVEAAQAAPRLGGDAADEAALRGDPTRERVLWRVGREGERAEAKHKSAKRHAEASNSARPRGGLTSHVTPREPTNSALALHHL